MSFFQYFRAEPENKAARSLFLYTLNVQAKQRRIEQEGVAIAS